MVMIYNKDKKDFGLSIELTYNGIQWVAICSYPYVYNEKIFLDRKIQSKESVETWAFNFACGETFRLKFV